MKTGKKNDAICAVSDSSSTYWTDVVCKCVFQAFPGTFQASSWLQLDPGKSLVFAHVHVRDLVSMGPFQVDL